jgi:hypothetical protein
MVSGRRTCKVAGTVRSLGMYRAAEHRADDTGMLQFPHDERAAAASFGRGLVQAVEAARSARFEHGAGRQAIRNTDRPGP